MRAGEAKRGFSPALRDRGDGGAVRSGIGFACGERGRVHRGALRAKVRAVKLVRGMKEAE